MHGSFAESLSTWKPVLASLLAKGYKVVAAPNPLRGVSSDAAYVSSILNTIDGPIILVAALSRFHSSMKYAPRSGSSTTMLLLVCVHSPVTAQLVLPDRMRFA